MMNLKLLGIPLLAVCAALSACSGEDGSAGAPGADGMNGKDGTNGKNGTNGKDGVDGTNGSDGSDGKDGKDGVDGMDGMNAAGASGTNPPSGYSPIAFSPVAFPLSDAEKRAVSGSPMVTVNGKTSSIGYKTIVRTGAAVGTAKFGVLTDSTGAALVATDNSQIVADSTDFSSLLPVGGKLFSISHLESLPGGMYLSELNQSATTGELTIASTKALDFAAWGGLWNPCAGSISPWGTHLGGEEYPPDARAYEVAADFDALDSSSRDYLRYYGLTAGATKAAVDAKYSPYAVGHQVEVAVQANGDSAITKHYSMGRIAFELSYMMPDQKTAYLSDDGSYVGFFMYIADVAGKLDAGTLYAMKWLQTSNVGGGAADIEWVKLGHATDTEIKAMLTAGTKFSDIFTAVAPTGNTCPSGVMSNAEGRVECLTVNPNMEKAAAFLETRRYASMLGATTELNKEEGISFDPNSNTLFVAISDLTNGMLDNTGAPDQAGPNAIHLSANRCGVVYALDLTPNGAVGSDYVASGWRALVAGVETNYAGTAYAGNTCSINGIANPDNVSFIAAHNTLIIGEDTGTGHQNDAIWSYDLVTRKMTRIETTPYGAETTSAYWYPNVNGFSYLMSVVQHPYGESDADKLASGSGAEHAYVGYIGPIPVK